MRQDWRRSEFANPAWRIPRRGENPAKGPQIPAVRRLERLWERLRKDPEDGAATSAGRLFSLYSMQARMAYAGEYFLERYGRKATRGAPPLRDVLNAGLPLGLGSDATRVASYNPWNTLYWATTGRSIGGTALHGLDQRLTREEALFHHTVGSAWFSQEEVLKGRLSAGQFADFALLQR